MKKYYLVDLENVKNSGLEGIEQLSSEDRVIVFYSDKADTLKIDVIQKIKEGKAAVTFIKADNGTPNSLDFQLITYLFYHIALDEAGGVTGSYWIISKDTGYEASIRMAKKMGLNCVRRAPAIINAVHYQVRADKNNAAQAAEKEESAPAEAVGLTDEDAPEVEEEQPDEEAYAVLNEKEADEEEEQPAGEQNVEGVNNAIRALLHDKCNLDIDQQMMDMVVKALQNSENKNQFYQYFRRHMGSEDGSRFYKSIRNQYNALKEICQN